MKTKTRIFAAVAVCLCLFVATASLRLNPKSMRALRFQWEQTIADAKTMGSLVRYLLTPELPAQPSRPLTLEIAVTESNSAAPQLTRNVQAGTTDAAGQQA